MSTLTAHRLRLFLRQVVKAGGVDTCWGWDGAKNCDGYAMFSGDPAHRVAYEWMVGSIPAGMELDHLCRNRACVNPHHLEPVSKATNAARRTRSDGFVPVAYCRHGHAMTEDNVRMWSNGKSVLPHCYKCHRIRTERRHRHVS